VFRFTMVNSGGGTAHAFTETQAPAGWAATFLPHEPVEPGKTKVQELTVEAPANAQQGAYAVHAAITYRKGAEDARSEYNLTLNVVGPSGSAGPADTSSGAAKGSPIGPFALLGIAVAGLAARRVQRAK
jgi:uncharacterized membrane protein